MKKLLFLLLASAVLLGCETVPSHQVARTQEELLFESGLDAMDDDDLHAAERHFKDVLKANPGNIHARHYLHEIDRVLE